MVGTFLMLLGVSIILYCSWAMLRGDPNALADRFPGPVTIGVSIPRYLVLFAICGAFAAEAIAIFLSPETFAVNTHGRFRGEGLLHLLVFLHVARDKPQAIAQFGCFAAALSGVGALAWLVKPLLSITGSWGLTLDEEGFTETFLRAASVIAGQMLETLKA
jgi:hypothetical protein